jgi:LytS/YehU family sensor histidine kinase
MAVEIDEIKNSIRLKIEDNTEDYANDGEKMDKNIVKHQKRDQEMNSNEQHTARNKLKERLQIMWPKVRLLQMSEREKLPKLKQTAK